MILLIGVAAGTDDLDAFVARTLCGIGWMQSDGRPIMSGVASRETRDLLQRLGGLTGNWSRRDERPTPEGVTFARAVLRTRS